ncbi:unnamed protein product [Sphagnum jensenii]|uniref:Glycerophosphocholine acyltransferase 1 n=1 Tax=Sphagnum jensenii TaxID=128206 RepID=A0ABP1BUH9_9BRYO
MAPHNVDQNGEAGEHWQQKELGQQRMGRKGSRSPPKVVLQTKEMITKQAGKIAKRADEHEAFITKVTYSMGVASFGTFCFWLGSRPDDIPYLYCLFFITIAPLRWIYYRIKKWHYYLLDFCYYANAIFVTCLLFFPNNDKLFLVCFSFAEGPLAWALIVWRCSLVFSSIDKIVGVLIHLLPGIVFFIIRWWDPQTFSPHSPDETGPWPAWPLLESNRSLWIWLFVVPLFVYSVWQMIYYLVVNVLRRQRILGDPEVMTSYKELSRKASRANNIWWRLCGLMGDKRRVLMYVVLQAIFTVLTMALTVPMFKSYHLHIFFECFKVSAAVWNGGNFFFDVMPRKLDAKKKRKFAPTPAGNGSNQALANGNSNGATAENPIDLSSHIKFEQSPEGLELEEPRWCTNCMRTNSPNLSDKNGAQKAMGEQENEVKKDSTVQEEPAKNLVNVPWLRRKAGACSGEMESPQATIEHFDHLVCAS